MKEDDTITTKTTDYTRDFSQRGFVHADEVEACPICKSTEREVDSQKAEVICAGCGLVLEENLIDHGPEWRAFNHEQRDSRARTGAPLTYAISDRGLNTVISPKNVDSNGRQIPEANRLQMHRLRKWNKRMRVSGSGERNLAFALSEMDRLSSRLGVPRSVRENAAVIYRQAAKRKIIRGRSIESVVAASVYTACRQCNIPRTLDEVGEASKVSKKQLGKTYRFLARELKIKLNPTSPTDYIARFASNLGLSGLVQAKAIEILNKTIDNGLSSGKGPTGLAASALYLASILEGERKTQKEVAEIAGVTEVTIRNRCKELSELDLSVSL